MTVSKLHQDAQSGKQPHRSVFDLKSAEAPVPAVEMKGDPRQTLSDERKIL